MQYCGQLVSNELSLVTMGRLLLRRRAHLSLRWLLWSRVGVGSIGLHGCQFHMEESWL